MSTNPKPSYDEILFRLAKIDLKRRAGLLGVAHHDGGLLIPFFDSTYYVCPSGIADSAGHPPTDAVGQVLCRYILHSAHAGSDDNRRVTFRELEGGSPLISSFANNTNKLIASTFATRLQALEAIVTQMGARPLAEAHHFDLFARFDALPRLPIFMQFNAADGQFPAQAALLFNCSAQAYLDMDALFLLGTYLTGRLIRGLDQQDHPSCKR